MDGKLQRLFSQMPELGQSVSSQQGMSSLSSTNLLLHPGGAGSPGRGGQAGVEVEAGPVEVEAGPVEVEA